LIESLWTKGERRRILQELGRRLWLFVRRHARTYREAEQVICRLTPLTDADLRHLRSVHFLLSDATHQAITNSVPRILRRLSKSTSAQLVTTRGAVRGRIDWWETYRERLSHGYDDRSIHRFRESFRLYDLPENRLVKHLVMTVEALCAEIGVSAPAAGEFIDPSRVRRWTTEVENIRFLCGRYLKNVYMHQIGFVSRVTGNMLYAARTARNPAYREVAAAYDLLLNLVLTEDPHALRKALDEMVLAPLDDAVLCELLVLFSTMDALEGAGWTDKRLRLIGRSRHRAMARYESSETGAAIDLWYQSLPPNWGLRSRYTDLFAHYDLLTQTRLPDIILEVSRGASVARLLVEVKLSENRGYIADSAYKVLGYLNDFRDAYGAQAAPLAILAVWDGVKRKPGYFLNDEIIIATHTNYGAYLMDAIGSLLAQLPETAAVA